MQIASILFLFLFLHHVESSGDMNLFKVNSGHCMDGTPAAYYFRPSNNSTKWMLSLQGGGACYTKDECTSRSKGDLGSSKNYKSTYTGNRWFSADATSNPDFYDFNTVYVPYCSSDVHSGQQTNVSALTWGFYFSGHLNLVEIVKDIQTKHSNNWNKMTKMLITGGSAGGVGTFFNADWLATQIPTNAIIKAAPVGGWFFAGNYPDQVKAGRPYAPPSKFNDFDQGVTTDPTESDKFIQELWQSYHVEGCPEAQETGMEYKCGTVHVAYHFIKTPVYIMENMYDSNQITAQGGLPSSLVPTPEGEKYIEYMGRGMRNSTSKLKKGDGIFLSSCYDHTSGLSVDGTTKINGHLSSQIQGDWFYSRGNTSLYILRDTCDAAQNNLPCNPSCRGIGPDPTSPPSDKCSEEVSKICPESEYSTPNKCGQCAERHLTDLLSKGCTKKEVTDICEERKQMPAFYL